MTGLKGELFSTRIYCRCAHSSRQSVFRRLRGRNVRAIDGALSAMAVPDAGLSGPMNRKSVDIVLVLQSALEASAICVVPNIH